MVQCDQLLALGSILPYRAHTPYLYMGVGWGQGQGVGGAKCSLSCSLRSYSPMHPTEFLVKHLMLCFPVHL